MVFASARGGGLNLWRIQIDAHGGPAGPPEARVATTREDSRRAWSRDGRFVVFNSDRGGDMNLWLLSLEDGSQRQLPSGPGGDFQPRFSPNGDRVAFFGEVACLPTCSSDTFPSW